MGSTLPPLALDEWYKLVDAGDNDPRLTPATAPARADSQFEIFHGLKYTVLGAFMTPEARSKIKVATEMEAGGDPTTQYMVNFLSRKFGPVYVFRANCRPSRTPTQGPRSCPRGR